MVRESLDVEKVYAKLAGIHDPEIGAPITEIKLIDQVDIHDGIVSIKFHLTIPYCPPVFAIRIAGDIVDAVSSLEGVKFVDLEVSGHYLSGQINKALAARRNSELGSHGGTVPVVS